MRDKLLGLVMNNTKLLENEKVGVGLAVGGMAALLAGQKLAGLAMFAAGAAGIEKRWRKAHPEFQGGLKDRWKAAIDFYETQHKNDVNRKLHIVGIPMIVGGAVGLLASPSYTPPWLASAGLFAGGWALNIVGHAVYEKNKPAFSDDPLSFLAGPAWDLAQVFTRGATAAGADDASVKAAA